MAEKNSFPQHQYTTKDLSGVINPPQYLNAKMEQRESETYGIFETHEQMIQATYNFKSLFRKKRHLHTMHKNKKNNFNRGDRTEVKEENGEKMEVSSKKGHWTAKENKKYHWFLELHNNHFISKHLRRKDKIFKSMSSFIGTRQAEQCRSHHQKMQKKYLHFYTIIKELRKDHYETCETKDLQLQLQQNGHQSNKIELIDSGKLNQQICQSHLKKYEKQDNQINEVQSQEMKLWSPILQQPEDKDHCEEFQSKEKQANVFFGENYENQLKYKLY